MSDGLGDAYDADYFLCGCESGKSLYKDYRWLPELTVPMASTMVEYLGIERNHVILDFGCARGYTVRAFRELGYQAWGVDISRWAVDNCDPTVTGFVACGEIHRDAAPTYDWVIAKDVLEHVPNVDETVARLMQIARCGVFVVVPLADQRTGRYVIGAYEKDVTHIHRDTLQTWVGRFVMPGWSVKATYRVPGVKDNYWRPKFERGNGFITATRDNWGQ